ncbi:M20 family metallopeptidase [Bacillus pseudomycoides]|uniref:M20 family metallopeptidase n=1 Tax=Bacillus pseudomycoides TaxID=64104 RepID=UPI001FB36059|nr:M20 family metallopeptidase [Bacillus pseudomycoides]
MSNIINKGEAINLLKKLISIPSQVGQENENGMIEFVSSFLHELGLKYSIHYTSIDKLHERPNLICKVDFDEEGPCIILNGHTDTKPAYQIQSSNKNWSFNPFEGELFENKLYGRGSCDMKAGLASYLVVIKSLMEKKESLKGSIILQFVADEEMGSNFGMKNLQEFSKIRADLAIVAEPTDNDICIAELGNLWIKLIVKTQDGHAGFAWMYENAIDHSNRVIESFRQAIDTVKSETRDALFPNHPALNIGSIRGGHHPGSVPGYCEALLDIRIRPNETQKHYLALTQKIVKEYLRENQGVQIEITEYLGGGFPPGQTKKIGPLIQQLHDINKLHNGSETLKGFYGGSDAYYFMKNDIPTVVFGPGSLHQAHAVDEFVSLDQYLTYIEILHAFLEQNLA